MWSPFSLFRSDNSQSTAPTSSSTSSSSSSQRIQTKVIIDAEKSAGEYTILLLRRVRRWLNLQRRTHPYIISAILITTTTALGITFSYKWCICRKQQQQCVKTENETSLGSWKLRWSWIPPFMRIVDNRAGDGIRTNEGSCFANTNNNTNTNNNNNNKNQKRRKCPFLFTSAPVVEDDDINFVDATESAFRMFQRRVERTHEAPLLRVLSELETLGEDWRNRNNSQKTIIPPAADTNINMNSDNNNNNNNNNNNTVITEEEEKEDTLRECIRQKAIEADELLTQFIVQLDLAPVGDSAVLKKERKALITSAAALADRIAVWMHLSPQME